MPKFKLAILFIAAAILPFAVGAIIKKTDTTNSAPVSRNANMLVIPVDYTNDNFQAKYTKRLYSDMFSSSNNDSFKNIIYNLTWGAQKVRGTVMPVQHMGIKYVDNRKLCDAYYEQASKLVNKIKETKPNYDEYVVVGSFPCWWAGLTNQANQIILINGKQIIPQVITHEMLHAMGMAHSSSLDCNDNRLSRCQSDEYGDPYSVMGRVYTKNFITLTALERYELDISSPKTMINYNPTVKKYDLYHPKKNSNKPTFLQIPINNNHSFSKKMQASISSDKLSYFIEYTKPKVMKNMFYVDMAQTPSITIRISKTIDPNTRPLSVINSYLLSRKMMIKPQKCWKFNALTSKFNTFVDKTNHLIIKVNNLGKNKASITVKKTPKDFNFNNYIKNVCKYA